MWIFSNEPKGKVYKELIDTAAKLCDEFTLVRRDDYNGDLSKNIDVLVSELSDFLIEVKEQQSWPGTKLLEGYAKVYYYKLNDITKELLKKYSKSLYDWKKPILLEDLCFLKKGRKPWIINIAHEKFSYIENSTKDDIIKLKSIEGIKLEELDVL